MPDIIAVGEILAEFFAQKPGQSFAEPGSYVGPFVGGSPAVALDQAVRMGTKCGLIACVGDDDFGRMCRTRLGRDGVDVSRVLFDADHPTGTMFVSINKEGKQKAGYLTTLSAADAVNPDMVTEEAFAGAKYLLVMGGSLVSGEGMRAAITKAVDIARAGGVRVCFDPNIRPDMLEKKGVGSAFEHVLSRSDILLTSEDEALQLAGCAGLIQAVDILRLQGSSMVVVKRGAAGARIFAKEHAHDVTVEAEAYPVDEIVDKTGAGDCFDGAFLGALCEGRSMEQALRMATIAGALSITRMGPLEAAPVRKEMIEILERR